MTTAMRFGHPVPALAATLPAGPSSAQLLLLLCGLPFGTMSAQHQPPRKLEVAPDVYLFTTPSYGDVGLDGNTVVILSRNGVLVFDANGTPAAAANVLAEIRRMTDQPVRYVVYSHWHWDHWYGAEVYRDAFPGAVVISHERTRALMAGPALAFNQPNLDTFLPAHIEDVAAARDAARAAAPPGDTAALERHIEADRFFLAQKRSVRHALATLTFTDSLTIHLDGRPVRILHYDRAVTPGDAFLYLPDDGLVVSGDLLVNPVSFALSCYPSGWLRTLERIRSLHPRTIIPGHGEPLHDPALLDAHITLFTMLLREGTAARDRGLDVEQAKDTIVATHAGLGQPFTGGDPAREAAFRLYLVDWFLHRVYDELQGPLTDDITPIPRHSQ